MTSRLILAYVDRRGGPGAVPAMLERIGMAHREAELRNENRWFSFATKIALFQAAGELLDDPRIGRSVGRAALELDIGSGLKRVLRALGTPSLVYRNIVRACAKFSWTHRMTALEVGQEFARIRYEDVSGTGYHQHDCDYNLGLLAAVTELFGLPPARVGHAECALRGADACVYELRWAITRRSTTWMPVAASTGTAAAGATALAGIGGALPVTVACAVVAAALGLRAARDRTRSFETLARRMTQQDEAADRLSASLRDLSADLRPDEVLEKLAWHAQSAVGGKEFALLLDDGGMQCVRSSGIPGRTLAALEAWSSRAEAFGDEPVIVDDVSADSALAVLLEDRDMPLGSLCAAPLLFKGELLGMLVALAHGREAFLPHDAQLISAYAAQAAVTLHNAQLVEQLERLALEDGLTGVANQRHFHARLAAEGNRTMREAAPLSVVVIDLDHFKRINDTHGHGRGDDVLRAVGAALRGGVRPYDTVARLGGEEFALLLPGSDPRDAEELAERVRAAIGAVQVEGITLSCSAGVACYPDDTEDIGSLLRCADQALYAAKRAGRGRTRRYDASAMLGQASDEIVEAIRRLLDVPDDIQIVFQPVMGLATGRVAGFEALARFPTLDDMRPDVVFRIAHEAGLGPELEALAIRRALSEPDRPPGTALCLNASPSALASPNLWAELPLDLSGIVIEITEHELYESDAHLQDALSRLRERGARIAVDDTGAGYAGLQQLARVRPEMVKLDRALVDGVSGDAGKAALIEAFVRFAAGTGAIVCAEGVEELEDLRVLAELDVTVAQGYTIARPAPGWVPISDEASWTVAGAVDGGVRELSGRAGLGEQLDRLQDLVGAGDHAGATAIVAGACRADHVAFLPTAGAVGRARSHVLASGVPGQVLLHDPTADPDESARLQDLACRSLLLVPVIEGGRTIGLLEAARRQEEPWTRVDAERAQLLARQLAPLLAA